MRRLVGNEHTNYNKDRNWYATLLEKQGRTLAMVSSTGVRDTITTLSDLQQRLGISQTQNNTFFSEWVDTLPALNLQEQQGIDRIKQRYDYQRVDGLLLESTINLVVTSPLLELLGFIDPPFHLKSPYGISLELRDPIETIRGFIDVLVIQKHLWILTVESKRSSISIPAAFPQLLAYLAAKPRSSISKLWHGDQW